METESAKRKEEVERELTTTKNELDTARSKIKLYADYDEIKRELEIMKVQSSSHRLGVYSHI